MNGSGRLWRKMAMTRTRNLWSLFPPGIPSPKHVPYRFAEGLSRAEVMTAVRAVALSEAESQHPGQAACLASRKHGVWVR